MSEEIKHTAEQESHPHKQRNTLFQVRLPLYIAMALVVGVLIGANTFSPSGNNPQSTAKGYLKFRDILSYIDRDYVDTVDIEKLSDYAITKMLEKLDPHTSYIPAEELAMARSYLEGDFEGIGVEFNIFKDTIYVITPLSGGPSEAAGIQAGDKIIKVDGKNLAGVGITNEMVFKHLRGAEGTKVNLSILRKGSSKPLTFNLQRNKIPTSSVDVSYMVNANTGYIKVSRFSANTFDEFKQALTSLKKKGMQQLILDLRGNPGGYMDHATRMADEFIAGDKLIVYTDGKGTKYDSKTHARTKGDFENGSLIVLVDEGSASASEIVAGALQDNDRALIVGRRSFGKGLVQMPIPLNDGSELRLTISRYYTPSGRSIQKSYVDGAEWGFEEGCLSIPGVREMVYRPERIVIRYFDEEWNEHTDTYDGMTARVIQHEYDHIEGILFTDHLNGLKKRLIKNKLTKISKGEVDADYRMKFPAVDKRR